MEVGFSPELENVKVFQVKPYNGQFKGQVRRAIAISDAMKVIRASVESGNKKSRELERKLVEEGARRMGIAGAVLENNVLTPIDEDGNKIKEFEMQVDDCDGVVVDGWLLIENIEHHNPSTGVSDVTELTMLINMMVAAIAKRKNDFSVPLDRLACVEYMQHLLPDSGLDEIIVLDDFEETLNSNSEAYEALYHTMLSETRKQAVMNPHDLPERIRECTEVKSMIEARKDPAVKLINGWMHPLSEVSKINGSPMCNSWQFASLVMGAATQRVEDTEDSKAIAMMVSLGVIKSPLSEKLYKAKTDDTVYLELLSAIKEATDQKVQEQLGSDK